MNLMKSLSMMCIAVVLSGCAMSDFPSRNATFDGTTPGGVFSAGTGAAYLTSAQLAAVDVVAFNVSVPQTLKVSEAHGYYPAGDIVWRGEPLADRYLQVRRIFDDGIARGLSALNGQIPARLDIEVERFHSVTEKTRYTIGGVHSIRFKMALRHAQTGEPLMPPRVVKANLKAYGGQKAVEAEREGQTQRVRVVAHLANVIQAELGRPPRKTGTTAIEDASRAPAL